METAAEKPRRWTADERREAVIEAAVNEFAAAGLAGASTERIAKRAGISHAYLFRLFGTKRDLFVATVHRSFGSVREAFAAAAAQREPGQSLFQALGVAYRQMLLDNDYLHFQYTAYAATADDEVRAVVREEYMTTFAWVREQSGASEDMVRLFMATGLLMTLGKAIDDPGLSPDGTWSWRVIQETDYP